MKTCVHCNTQNEDNAAVCEKCGTMFNSAIVTNPEKIHCRNCGKELVKDAYACTGCGLPPYKGKNFCQVCGAATNTEAIICIKCGSKLNNTSFAMPKIPSVNTEGFLTKFNNTDVTKNWSFWGAVFCFLGFFLPWVSIWYFDGNGFTCATKALSDFAPARILLLLIPVASGVIIFNLMQGKLLSYFKFLKFIPLALLVIFLLIIQIKLSDTGNDLFTNIFKVIGFGFYLTFIGSILMCFLETE